MSPAQQLDQLTAALSDLAKSLRYAKQYQPEAIPGLQTQYRSIMQQAAVLRGQVSGSEQPSAFMLALSNFSDQATAVAKQLGGDAVNVVHDTLKATSTTLRLLPWVVGGAILLLGVVLLVGVKKGSIRASLSPRVTG